jgi:thermostable 8-oxoguanine DNA glycosylase
MINPTKITNFRLDKNELEEHLLFWVTAAGKNAMSSARGLEKFLRQGERLLRMRGRRPFEMIRRVGAVNITKISSMMKDCGIGCYNQKAKTFWEIANSGLDLKICTTDDLEQITGIGRKTSRCFIIHSRKSAGVAGLDTHALKFLRDSGFSDAPKATPSSKKQYEYWERQYVELQEQSGLNMAEYDLMIWNRYSGHVNRY